ncbi:MAG: MBG domain-containing protein [Cytophagaceae bacterium]
MRRQFLKCSLTFIFILFLSFSSECRIIYNTYSLPYCFVPISPGTMHNSHYNYPFDLDGDGVTDFQLLINCNGTASSSSTGYCNGDSYNYWTEIITQTLGFPILKIASLNTLVDQAFLTGSSPNIELARTTSEIVVPHNSCRQGFSVSSHKYDEYFAFSFTKNAQKYYGYCKIRSGSYLDVYVENIPNYPITVGDTRGYFQHEGVGANTIRGRVYNDINNNCVFNTGEKGLAGINVRTNLGYSGVTDANGNYEIFLPGGSATYTLSIETNSFSRNNSSITCPSSNELSVSFAGNNQTRTANNFGLTINECSDLRVLVSSDRRRRCFRSNTRVLYRNHGRLQAENAEVKVIMPEYVYAISSVPAWNRRDGDTLFYNLGTVVGLGSGVISIVDSVICWQEEIRGLTQCTKAIISPHGECFTYADWDNSDVRIQGTCQDGEIDTYFHNIGTGDMSDSLEYRIFLDDELVRIGRYKIAAEDSFRVTVPVNGATLRIEADQSPYHPDYSYAYLAMEGCADPETGEFSHGHVNNFPLPVSYTESKHCMPIIDSYDPNDKLVTPEGFGEENKVLQSTNFDYKIRFQNTGTDVAYTVVVVDTLDANLDFSTFKFHGTSHNCKLEVAGTDRKILTFIFGGIDLPDSTSNEPKSHGYIDFSIKAKDELAVGTRIENRAHIFFDYNSAIITNTTSNKVVNSFDENFALGSNIKTSQRILSFLMPEVLRYGDNAFSPEALTTSGLPATFISSDENVLSISDGTVIIKSTGTVTLKAKQEGAANFHAAEEVIQSVYIEKAPLTIKADDKEIIYGETNPEFTYHAEGLMYDDNESVLSGEVVFTAPEEGAGAGVYDILVSEGTLHANNYTLAFEEGVLTVHKALLKIIADDKESTYGDAVPVFTYQFEGFVYNDTEADVSGEAETGVNGGRDAGIYAIAVSEGTLSSNNYHFEFESGSYVIHKALLSVTADDKQRLTGESNPVFTWSASGFKFDDDNDVIYGEPEIVCDADNLSPAGNYPIFISVGSMDANNYDFSFANGTLRVDQATGVRKASSVGISVGPVPSQGSLTIFSPYQVKEVMLTDALGRTEVHYGTTINTHLKGIVMMTIETDQGRFTEKIDVK